MRIGVLASGGGSNLEAILAAGLPVSVVVVDRPCRATELAEQAGVPSELVEWAGDRLDFTVIGPAVNEVARIETLCEPLGRKVLISAEFASVVGDSRSLEPLGYHTLRGVRDPRKIYALDLGF